VKQIQQIHMNVSTFERINH